ncbi:hypothetical protein ABH518_07540 [Staphylococcus aureus]|nr:hypothetical protein [Staphylococcus aureus]MBF1915585.1 hypothetical protein [Staphylococcus aureus]MBK4094552.1 hypothetical protein [Staphylococcus aureus]MBY0852267.1 hypothetical protein [Staphylococcus aureus]MCZ4104472.1 hypothetical protein [Staphylococcus aureus]MDT3938762.1 hypothetical protein [Staphylococcus aureus]
MNNKVVIKLSCVVGNLFINQSNRHYNAYWWGPNKEKLDPQFQQAMQVGGAPTKRNWNTNFNKQCKLAGPQQREIGTPISTSNASWGRTTNLRYNA